MQLLKYNSYTLRRDEALKLKNRQKKALIHHNSNIHRRQLKYDDWLKIKGSVKGVQQTGNQSNEKLMRNQISSKWAMYIAQKQESINCEGKFLLAFALENQGSDSTRFNTRAFFQIDLSAYIAPADAKVHQIRTSSEESDLVTLFYSILDSKKHVKAYGVLMINLCPHSLYHQLLQSGRALELKLSKSSYSNFQIEHMSLQVDPDSDCLLTLAEKSQLDFTFDRKHSILIITAKQGQNDPNLDSQIDLKRIMVLERFMESPQLYLVCELYSTFPYEETMFSSTSADSFLFVIWSTKAGNLPGIEVFSIKKLLEFGTGHAQPERVVSFEKLRPKTEYHFLRNELFPKQITESIGVFSITTVEEGRSVYDFFSVSQSFIEDRRILDKVMFYTQVNKQTVGVLDYEEQKQESPQKVDIIDPLVESNQQFAQRKDLRKASTRNHIFYANQFARPSGKQCINLDNVRYMLNQRYMIFEALASEPRPEKPIQSQELLSTQSFKHIKTSQYAQLFEQQVKQYLQLNLICSRISLSKLCMSLITVYRHFVEYKLFVEVLGAKVSEFLSEQQFFQSTDFNIDDEFMLLKEDANVVDLLSDMQNKQNSESGKNHSEISQQSWLAPLSQSFRQSKRQCQISVKLTELIYDYLFHLHLFEWMRHNDEKKQSLLRPKILIFEILTSPSKLANCIIQEVLEYRLWSFSQNLVKFLAKFNCKQKNSSSENFNDFDSMVSDFLEAVPTDDQIYWNSQIMNLRKFSQRAIPARSYYSPKKFSPQSKTCHPAKGQIFSSPAPPSAQLLRLLISKKGKSHSKFENVERADSQMLAAHLNWLNGFEMQMHSDYNSLLFPSQMPPQYFYFKYQNPGWKKVVFGFQEQVKSISHNFEFEQQKKKKWEQIQAGFFGTDKEQINEHRFSCKVLLQLPHEQRDYKSLLTSIFADLKAQLNSLNLQSKITAHVNSQFDSTKSSMENQMIREFKLLEIQKLLEQAQDTISAFLPQICLVLNQMCQDSTRSSSQPKQSHSQAKFQLTQLCSILFSHVLYGQHYVSLLSKNKSDKPLKKMPIKEQALGSFLKPSKQQNSKNSELFAKLKVSQKIQKIYFLIVLLEKTKSSLSSKIKQNGKRTFSIVFLLEMIRLKKISLRQAVYFLVEVQPGKLPRQKQPKKRNGLSNETLKFRELCKDQSYRYCQATRDQIRVLLQIFTP